MFKNFFNRQSEEITDENLFDEAFLRRMERLNFRTAAALRGKMMGERVSRKLRPSLDFSDHRPYTSGDDFRYVDWYAYGRQEELFVKLGEATQRVNIHILLDASPSMSWAPTKHYVNTSSKSSSERRLKSNKWNTARRLAGALSYLGLAAGERVRITPFTHTLGEGFGPTQGKRQITATLQYLTDLHPSSIDNGHSVEGGLADSLVEYAGGHNAGGILVLISDMLDTTTSDDLVRSAGALTEGLRYLLPPRWQVLVMHLVTMEEMDPTVNGDFDMTDVETRKSLPLHVDETLLAQYRLRVEYWCTELQYACSSRAATYSRIVAEWPLERKVVPYLRQQGLLR